MQSSWIDGCMLDPAATEPHAITASRLKRRPAKKKMPGLLLSLAIAVLATHALPSTEAHGAAQAKKRVMLWQSPPRYYIHVPGYSLEHRIPHERARVLRVLCVFGRAGLGGRGMTPRPRV